MKGFICKQLPRAEALFRNTVRLPISVSNITKSSGPQAGRDLVILLRLEGQKVNVSKLNQHTGVSKGEVDIYELTFKPAGEDTNTEILIYSPSSIQIEESGSYPLVSCQKLLTSISRDTTKKKNEKNMDGINAK